MSVAHISNRFVTPATGASVTSGDWAIAGTDLAIVLYIAVNATAAATVTSVSWSLGSGTPYEVGVIKQGNCNVYIWAIPAPTAGTGTYTVNFSESAPFQVAADVFSGTDQTTPCPIADEDEFSVVNDDGATQYTITPTNVGANDAMAACIGHIIIGDTNLWATGTDTYQSNSTAINLLTGYRLAAAPMVSNVLTASGATIAGIGVRVQAPTSGFTPTITGTLQVGQTLTAHPSAQTSYQWYRADDATGTNEVAISGETGETLLLTSADADKYIRVGIVPA